MNKPKNNSCSCQSSIFTVISGSFRKHLKEISQLKDALEMSGIVVLSPTSAKAINPNDEFIVLDSDPIDNPKLLQDSVFAKIRKSSFLMVANVNGYIGAAATMEIGYAIATGIPVYVLEEVADPNLAPYCQLISNVIPKLDRLLNKSEQSWQQLKDNVITLRTKSLKSSSGFSEQKPKKTKTTLNMPLLDSVISSYSGPSLSRTKIIGVQHILETTHAMFQALELLGLRKENVSLIGKCYSTCEEVRQEMLYDGYFVSDRSKAYHPHCSWDSIYEQEVLKFSEERFSELVQGEFDRIVILDDGGKLIKSIQSLLKSRCDVPIVAVEQTTSGYEAIKNTQNNLPIINVARSPAKLKLESPMIAKAAIDRFEAKLDSANIRPSRTLIIGGGAIGTSIYQSLSHRIDTYLYDISATRRSTGSKSLEGIIGEFDLIIGCTGFTSVSQKIHHFLSPGTVLVSTSSSDREFDAVHLRKQVAENSDCHLDVWASDVLLLNSGFPVNFDGERENIDPEYIQLTMALLTSGLLQACQLDSNFPATILPLDSKKESEIVSDFSELQIALLQN